MGVGEGAPYSAVRLSDELGYKETMNYFPMH